MLVGPRCRPCARVRLHALQCAVPMGDLGCGRVCYCAGVLDLSRDLLGPEVHPRLRVRRELHRRRVRRIRGLHMSVVGGKPVLTDASARKALLEAPLPAPDDRAGRRQNPPSRNIASPSTRLVLGTVLLMLMFVFVLDPDCWRGCADACLSGPPRCPDADSCTGDTCRRSLDQRLEEACFRQGSGTSPFKPNAEGAATLRPTQPRGSQPATRCRRRRAAPRRSARGGSRCRRSGAARAPGRRPPCAAPCAPRPARAGRAGPPRARARRS